MKIGKNSKVAGFSLIELIVVIAIMAVTVGMVGISVSVLNGKKISKCADDIVATVEMTRVLTLGKEQNAVECVIDYDSAEKNYIARVFQDGAEVSSRIVGSFPVDIRIYFDGEAAGYELIQVSGSDYAASQTQGLHLMFDRASGAFYQNTNKAGGAVKKYCKKIVLTEGSRKIEINLVGKTGKITAK